MSDKKFKKAMNLAVKDAKREGGIVEKDTSEYTVVNLEKLDRWNEIFNKRKREIFGE